MKALNGVNLCGITKQVFPAARAAAILETSDSKELS
jgi:hypothetical protein